jgi:hypothetical protein
LPNTWSEAPLPKARAEAGDIVLLSMRARPVPISPALGPSVAGTRACRRLAVQEIRQHSIEPSVRSSSPNSRTKRGTAFIIAHLQGLDRLYGPKPRKPIKPVISVLDSGPIHVKATPALAERADWLTVEWLPMRPRGGLG